MFDYWVPDLKSTSVLNEPDVTDIHRLINDCKRLILRSVILDLKIKKNILVFYTVTTW